MMHFAMSKGYRKPTNATAVVAFVALVLVVSTTRWTADGLNDGDQVHAYVSGKGVFSGSVANVSFSNDDDEEFVVMIRGRGLRGHGHASHHSSFGL